MMDRNAEAEAECAFQKAAGKVKDAARGLADNVGTASSGPNNEDSELVAKAPRSAPSTAGDFSASRWARS
jgi:hypothetical protein